MTKGQSKACAIIGQFSPIGPAAFAREMWGREVAPLAVHGYLGRLVRRGWVEGRGYSFYPMQRQFRLTPAGLAELSK